MGEWKEEKMEKTRDWGKESRTKGQQDAKRESRMEAEAPEENWFGYFVAQFDMDLRSP